jgi:alpha-N-arabinofuranosidase
VEAFRVGTVSLMPADNVNGMRADTLALLKELDSPVYRWPGGNFVSGYDWRDGIGDPDRRPPRKNPAWKGIEHNDFGIHEFIAFCRELGTEPYVTVNTGLGSVESTAEEVAYCNGPVDSPLGKLRAANGHPEPFGVEWWAVGNEMYGSWQLGHMPLEKYVEKHNRCAEAMRAADPSIKLVAVGAVGRWTERMLAGCADHMEMISEHFYVQEMPGVMAHASLAPMAVKRICDAHRRYRGTIPVLSGKDIRIAMDEWNYWYGPHVYGELGVRYFLKDALGVAAALHEYFRNSDIVFMANYAQTVNVIGCIKTSKTAAAFATTGLVLKLYRSEYGAIPVEITGAPEPLDVAAAWKEDRKHLTIGIVNPAKRAFDLDLRITGTALSGRGTLFRITGDDPMAYNEPGKPPRVAIVETQVRDFDGRPEVPPFSVSLYSMEVE